MCESTKVEPYYTENLARWDMELPSKPIPVEFKKRISKDILEFYSLRFPNSLVCQAGEELRECMEYIHQEGEALFDSVNARLSVKDTQFQHIIASISTLELPTTEGHVTPDQILLEKSDERLRFHDVVPFRYNHLHCMGSWITPSIGAMQWPLAQNLADLYQSVQENNVSCIISLGPIVDTLYWDPDVATQHTKGQVVTFTKQNDDASSSDVGDSSSLFSSSPVNSYHQLAGPSFGYSRSDPKLAQGSITIGSTRPVFVYRYDDWEDYDTPGSDSIEAVLSLAAILRWSGRNHRALVHCRAGVGRTGTLILLANCWSEWESYRRVDVFFELMKLRLRREHMVQQFSQLLYVFYVLDYIVTNDVRLDKYIRFSSAPQ